VAHLSKDRWRMACEDVRNQRVICVTGCVFSGVPQERHYTLVFPPLIFSFFGAQPHWSAAKCGLQARTKLPAKGWR